MTCQSFQVGCVAYSGDTRRIGFELKQPAAQGFRGVVLWANFAGRIELDNLCHDVLQSWAASVRCLPLPTNADGTSKTAQRNGELHKKTVGTGRGWSRTDLGIMRERVILRRGSMATIASGVGFAADQLCACSSARFLQTRRAATLFA